MRRARVVALALGLVAPLIALASPRSARAELPDDALRVANAWRAAGAQVALGKEQFLNEDEVKVLALPDLPKRRCTTVLLLGPRGLGFHVGLDLHLQDDPALRLPSEAGALSLERCDKPAPNRLLVAAESGRGALEVVVATSPAPLPALTLVLPERAEAHLGPMPDPGALAALAPQERRADVEEARARPDAALALARAFWPAGVDGTGSQGIAVDPGCHTFALFAAEPRVRSPHRGKLDLDAELRTLAGDRLLARDKTDAPDAHLSFCVGEATLVGVVFVGAPPGSLVLVTHLAWPMPEHVPSAWGSEGRGRAADALLAHHVGALAEDAVTLAEGGSGSTPVPITVEPGACYLVVTALIQGAARSVGVRVQVGGREAGDERDRAEGSATVAFCAGASRSAVAVVDARGNPLFSWGLAVYRVNAGIWQWP